MGHKHSDQIDVQEYIDKFDKFEWILDTVHHGGILENLAHAHGEHLTVPEFEDFQDNVLSNSDKLNFVLLALEKLHHHNPAAIPPEDSKYLHTARIGIIYKFFYWTAHAPIILSSIKMFVSRNYSLKIIGATLAYTIALEHFIMPIPMRYKEWIRRIRARPIALKYFEKNNGKLDLFKKILDPRTHPHVIHEMKL